VRADYPLQRQKTHLCSNVLSAPKRKRGGTGGVRDVTYDEDCLQGFYAAIAAGHDVGSAYAAGCDRMRLPGVGDADVPVLVGG
jgi:hypothetical protein